MLITCSAFFCSVTQAHPLEGRHINGCIAWHQAWVVASQNVGAFLTVRFGDEAGNNRQTCKICIYSENSSIVEVPFEPFVVHIRNLYCEFHNFEWSCVTSFLCQPLPGVRCLEYDWASSGLVHLPRGCKVVQGVNDATLRSHPVVGGLVVVNAELKIRKKVFFWRKNIFWNLPMKLVLNWFKISYFWKFLT